MIRFSTSVGWILPLIVAGISLGQDRSTPDDGWTPDLVYGKGGKERTSQPFVVRRYKVDPKHPNKVDKHQPRNFVKTISDGYKLAEDETVRVHWGVDLPSRPDRRSEPVPMEYKAGVYGKVVKAGGGDWNTITVQINDGSIVQYLHSSDVFVKEGQQVTPDTKLGLTGKAGLAQVAPVHLHIQAQDKDNKPISPDRALAVGRRRPATTIEWPKMKWVDVDIEASSVRVPNVKVVDRTVRITFDEKAPRVAKLEGTKWKLLKSNDGLTREGYIEFRKDHDFYGILDQTYPSGKSGKDIMNGKWTESTGEISITGSDYTRFADGKTSEKLEWTLKGRVALLKSSVVQAYNDI